MNIGCKKMKNYQKGNTIIIRVIKFSVWIFTYISVTQKRSTDRYLCASFGDFSYSYNLTFFIVLRVLFLSSF